MNRNVIAIATDRDLVTDLWAPAIKGDLARALEQVPSLLAEPNG